MPLEFPYQIVTFLAEQPELGEPVYDGVNGWYPQIALKRRFKLEDISEDAFIERCEAFFAARNLPVIRTGTLIKPTHMPVRVIEIINQDPLKTIHIDFLEAFAGAIISRFPERESDAYYPHVTAEYDGTLVIPVEKYIDRDFELHNVWLLKDVDDENARAFAKLR